MPNKIRNVILKILNVLGAVLTVLLTVFTAILCTSVRWMFQTWRNLSMDELMYHLTAPLEGTNEDMIAEYVNQCIVPAVLVLLMITVLFIGVRKSKKYYFVMAAGIVLSIVVSVIYIYATWMKLDIGNYLESQTTDSEFIETHYIDPAEVLIEFPEQKRNLILIFLESMEITYADKENGGAFDENVIPELTQIAMENEDFSGDTPELNGGRSMPCTTWTMAGMFAHTSGLPLNISISSNYMDTQDHFFADAVTMGDILEQQGYAQTLLIGSDATFGGRRLYFTEHGNYAMQDYHYAIEQGLIPSDYYVWWGYEDKKLFSYAKDTLMEMAEGEQPFNLTMLTVDTHFEDGYPCWMCLDDYKKEGYSAVMKCSSRQVSEFIAWIRQQDFYEDTTIVLVGDHPTMDSDYCEKIDENYIRKVYTAYINAAAQPETQQRREYTTFDTFPTVLAALGAEIEGNRLGLGVNLFSSEQTLIERFGVEKVSTEVGRKSKFMERMANIDSNKKEVLRRDGKLATADVAADVYQYDTGALPVTVTNINNMVDIQSVTLKVWTNADQSDEQWLEMTENEDGVYYANVNVPSFNYKVGDYYIEAYVHDSEGDTYCVGSTVGIVE